MAHRPGWQDVAVLRTVTALRYVMPLREGGSLPGLVEADDLGLYVVKFRAAGQGVRVRKGPSRTSRPARIRTGRTRAARGCCSR